MVEPESPNVSPTEVNPSVWAKDRRHKKGQSITKNFNTNLNHLLKETSAISVGYVEHSYNFLLTTEPKIRKVITVNRDMIEEALKSL